MFLNNHHEQRTFTITAILQQVSMSPTHYYVPLLEWNGMLVVDHHVMLGHCCETCSIFIVSL
jgi:hypothetical protein